MSMAEKLPCCNVPQPVAPMMETNLLLEQQECYQRKKVLRIPRFAKPSKDGLSALRK